MAEENQNQGIVPQKKSQQQQPKLIGTLELFNEPEVISTSYVSGLTIETAKKSIQFSLLKKELGAEQTGSMILKLINEISLLTNTTMDAGVKALCSKMIMNNFWHMKIDELLLVIRDGILGKYGKIYGNFCFTTLTEWIEKYTIEKISGVEYDNLTHTSHEKVIREREYGIDPAEKDPVQVSEHIKNMNNFWKDSEIKP